MTTEHGAFAAGLLGLRAARHYRATSVTRRRLAGIGPIGCEEIILTGIDGDEITCLYLTPAGVKPWRGAMIALHQHAARFELGKSEPAGLAGDPTLAYGLRLARAGFATLIPDLIGFESRQRPFADPAAAEQFDALSRIADGSSLQAKHAVDVAVATSWLQESDDSSGAIGIMGHSLGGQVALFSLAFDDRLRAAVISCGIGTVASFSEQHIPHNPAWFVPGLVPRGDVPALAAQIIDQRVLVVAGTDDPWFPVQGVHEVVAAFAAGVCDFRELPTGHELSAETLDDAIAWLQLTL